MGTRSPFLDRESRGQGRITQINPGLVFPPSRKGSTEKSRGALRPLRQYRDPDSEGPW